MTALVVILIVLMFIGGVIASSRINAVVYAATDDLHDSLDGLHERLDALEASVKAKLP